MLGSNEATIEHGKQTEAVVLSAIDSLKVLSRLETKTNISTEEVQLQIKTLKGKKAADTKGWVNEYLIYCGSEMAECIKIFSKMIIEQNQIPESWSQMRIKSICKEKIIKPRNKEKYVPET